MSPAPARFTQEATGLEALRRAIVAAVERRAAYVREHDLDAAFCLGDSNWRVDAANDYHALYRSLRDCPAGAIAGSLRPLTRNFSGYTMPTEIAPDDEWVQRWRRWTMTLRPPWLFDPPHLPGENGPVISGIVVNHDTYVCQERINFLMGTLTRLRNRPAVILEVGAGYGALALAIVRILPRASYIICDLPESLLFSGLYLALAGVDVRLAGPGDSALRPGPGVTLLPNYLFPCPTIERVDLAINTLSMSEMSAHQVDLYADGISEMIGRRGVFYEQNQDNRALGMLHASEIVARHFAKMTAPRPAGWFWRRSNAPTEGKPRLWSN